MSVAALVNGDGGLASLPGLVGMSVMSQASITYNNQLRGYAASFSSSAQVDTRLLYELASGTSMYEINADSKLSDEYFMNQLDTLQSIPETSRVPFDLYDSAKSWDFALDWRHGSVKIVKYNSVANHTTTYYIVVRAGVPESVLTEFTTRASNMRYCDLLTSAEYNRMIVCSELNRDRIAAALCKQLEIETPGRVVRELNDERVATPMLSNPSCYFEAGEDSQNVYFYNNCANTASATAGVLCENGAHAERWFQGNPATRTKDGGGCWENGILNACPTTTGQKLPTDHNTVFANVSQAERDSIRRRFVWEGVTPLTHSCVSQMSHGASPKFTGFMCDAKFVKWNMAWGFIDLETIVCKVARVVHDDAMSMSQLLSMHGDEATHAILPLANYDVLRFALARIKQPLDRHALFSTLSRDATTIKAPLALLKS